MKPNASLKSLKVKVRAIASRPGTSDQPASSANAACLASVDNRSAMLRLHLHGNFTLTPTGALRSMPQSWRHAGPGNHDRVPPTGGNKILLGFAAYRISTE